MVVHGHREYFLCILLAYDILIEAGAYLMRNGQIRLAQLANFICALHFLADNVIAQCDAFVAHKHRRPRNQLAHLVLVFSAKRAIQQFVTLIFFRRHLKPHSKLSATCFKNLCTLLQYLINQTVRHSCVSCQKIITLTVTRNFFDTAPGVF